MTNEIAAEHGRNPWRIAAALDIPIYRRDFPAGYREAFFEVHAPSPVRALLVDREADWIEARELIAHGLAHFYLHRGNRLSSTAAGRFGSQTERQADDFAAFLLVPSGTLKRALSQVDPPSLAEIASELQIPETVVQRRLQLLRRDVASPA